MSFLHFTLIFCAITGIGSFKVATNHLSRSFIPRHHFELATIGSLAEYRESAKIICGRLSNDYDLLYNVSLALILADMKAEKDLLQVTKDMELRQVQNYYLKQLSVVSQRYGFYFITNKL